MTATSRPLNPQALMYRNQPKPLGDLVSEFVTQYSDQKAIQRGMVLHRWREVVGEMIAEQCHSVRFDKRNRLILSVPSPPWRHEIHMQRMQLLELLNREAGAEVVTEIIVRS